MNNSGWIVIFIILFCIILPQRRRRKNAAILKMYENYMGKPGEGLAHDILHFKYNK